MMTSRRRLALSFTLVITAFGFGCRPAGVVVEPVPELPLVAETQTYTGGAVAADHPVASEAGAEMLRAGGNAVDAAVATSFCLSVVRPYSCGLGGGGFMIIALPDGTDVAIDYREQSPGAVGPTYFMDKPDDASRFGVHAVGVPGTVAGLLHALETYGTLDRATVLAPAIRTARDGFAADPHFVSVVGRMIERLGEDPIRADWFGRVWIEQCRAGWLAVGDLIQNPEQARGLELIARDGRAAFYDGPIGEAIVARVQADGGALTMADLAQYTVRTREPLRGTFGSYDVLAMPPPSSGGIAMLQIFGLLERKGIQPGNTGPLDPAQPDYVHTVTEAMKHAFADRARWLADDDFVRVPTEWLLSDEYLDGRATLIERGRTQVSEAYGLAPMPANDAGTSHISVIDADGMAVACTETINLEFGSLVEVPGFGFILNDEMDDFTTKSGAANAFGLTQSDRNVPVPGKRPLSSMSPTIVRDATGVRLVAGASGGPRIITGTVQTILNMLLGDWEPGRAVSAPRFHHQWKPDTLLFEDMWTADATIDAMRERGHDIGSRPDVGVVQVVERWQGKIRAASDPRKGGRPAGEEEQN